MSSDISGRSRSGRVVEKLPDIEKIAQEKHSQIKGEILLGNNLLDHTQKLVLEGNASMRPGTASSQSRARSRQEYDSLCSELSAK